MEGGLRDVVGGGGLGWVPWVLIWVSGWSFRVLLFSSFDSSYFWINQSNSQSITQSNNQLVHHIFLFFLVEDSFPACIYDLSSQAPNDRRA